MPRRYRRSKYRFFSLPPSWKKKFSSLVRLLRNALLKTLKVIKRNRINILSAAGLLFLLLEITLQIAAFATLRSILENPAKRILCVGDYFGRRRPSYPTKLKSELTRSGKFQYDVIDLMKEGMTSKMAANKVDQYLEAGQTEMVYLMIGRTDSKRVRAGIASKSNRHVLDPKTASFQWKLRTPGLLYRLWKKFSYKSVLNSIQPKFPKTIFRSVSNEKSVSQSNPRTTHTSPFLDFPIKDFQSSDLIHESETFPSGRWTLDGKVLDFETNGILSQEKPSKWWIRKSNLNVQNDGSTVSFFWQIRKDHLLLMYDSLPISIVLKKDPMARGFGKLAVPEELILGWQAMAQDNSAVAKLYFQKQLEDFPYDPIAHGGLALAHFQTGKNVEGQRELAIVKEMYRKAPDQRSAEALFYASQTASSSDKARLAEELIAGYPESPFLWALLAQTAYQEQCYNTADAAIKRAVELVPNTLRATKSDFLRTQANMLVERNPKAALQTLILAYLQDFDRKSFRSDLMRNIKQYSTLSIEDCFPADLVPKTHKTLLKSIFEKTTDENAGMIHTLEENVHYILNHCKIHRVPVVLILYPKRRNEANIILQQIIKDTDTEMIDLRITTMDAFRRSLSDPSKLDPSWFDQLVTNSILEDAKTRFH